MPDAPLLVPSKEDKSLQSVLYRGRYLYSKYNPSKAIIQHISTLRILPGTLILINSPALFYGLKELEALCPANCIIFALEAEPELYALSAAALKNLPFNVNVFLLDNLQNLDTALRNLVNTGKVKRVLPIDFSQGVQFAKPLYEKVYSAAQEIIALFWKNRITLSKMGKLFAKNIFRNLGKMSRQRQLCDVEKSVFKPILVCGAGESLDETLSAKNEHFLKRLKSGDFYILAVDAAVSALLERGIQPNGVVSLEAQFAIQKAFLGTSGCTSSTLFLDLCARTQSERSFGGSTVWFCSEYANAKFLQTLQKKGIVHSFIPPLGSVGICAVYIALYLRAFLELPVFVTGLDFSFTAARTHAKSVMAEKARLAETTRLKPLGSYGSAFSKSAVPVSVRNTCKMYSIPNMMQYAQTFCALFAGKKNVFDLSRGLPLGLPFITVSEIEKLPSVAQISIKEEKPLRISPAGNFLQEEKKALLFLKDLLTFGEESAGRDKTQTLSKQIEGLLFDRDYLFLHFPDGYAPRMDADFLKRVRAEIDFFLKQISLAEQDNYSHQQGIDT